MKNILNAVLIVCSAGLGGILLAGCEPGPPKDNSNVKGPPAPPPPPSPGK
jgi:hypothetical protein